MNSLPLDRIAARVLSISAMTRSYMSDFRHMFADRLLIARPAEIAGKRLLADDVLSGVQAATIISACSAGGVQISTTSISGSASSAVIAIGLRDAMFLGEIASTWSPRDATAVTSASTP